MSQHVEEKEDIDDTHSQRQWSEGLRHLSWARVSTLRLHRAGCLKIAVHYMSLSGSGLLICGQRVRCDLVLASSIS
jgi:hypothetical protein